MRTSELKEMTVEDLKERLGNTVDTYEKLRMDNVVSPIENPLLIRSTRRDIARLKTELRARQADQTPATKAPEAKEEATNETPAES